ncbi:hypothetical protein QN277_020278 [Acacia crassicarpa]|uniref:GDSL esterase/lipase n=1 Tax=Acacia crassicarpa TaxID=499986 RepID=A0AAE1JJE2_9FABA|nr:hypothetical protein QN277_020278 [Acacia crassicarpa]
MASHHKFLRSLFSLFLILLLSGQWIMQLEARHHSRHPKVSLKKLFVFGDSYADTGNIRRGLSKVWKEPYGTTFPGKPAGRFSDGRVLTDYIDLNNILKVVDDVPVLLQQHKRGDSRLTVEVIILYNVLLCSLCGFGSFSYSA